MGVSLNIYVVYGVKIPWDQNLSDKFEEYWEQNRESELPEHQFDGMSGEYMVLGSQLFDSGDFRYNLEAGDSFKKHDIKDLVHMERTYKTRFSRLFPEFVHIMDMPFELIMFAHYH